MMVEITQQEYEQYQAFLNNDLFYKKMESVKSAGSLERDIDAPIKNIVAMLALAGFEPIFSCCGFNYAGQPMHKTHNYGMVYVQMKANGRNLRFIEKAQPFFRQKIWRGFHLKEDGVFGGKIYLWAPFEQQWANEHGSRCGEHPWKDKDCIHYPEYALFAIGALEKLLVDNDYLLIDKIVLHDANRNMKDKFRNWQYPVLEPWIIEKDAILDDIHNS